MVGRAPGGALVGDGHFPRRSVDLRAAGGPADVLQDRRREEESWNREMHLIPGQIMF